MTRAPTRREALGQAGAILLALGTGARTAAAQDYPTRPVTMVVPYAAGGGLDILARQLQPLIEQRLGKPLIIDNRAGGGTVIGAASVANAAPDGYTLLFATSSALAINVTLRKSLSYDPTTSFTPVVLVANAPFILLANVDLGVATLEDFIKLAKARPGKLSYGSAGPGSPQHLFMELLKMMTGIQLVHVPYRGDAPALVDLMANTINVQFCESGTAQPHIAAGKVRALGVSSAKRMTGMPDIPPIAEAGVPGFDAVSWQMIVAPAGTPAAIVDKLHADTKSVLALPEVRAEFTRTGRIPVDSPPPAELAAFIKGEIVRWGKVVEAAGIAHSQ